MTTVLVSPDRLRAICTAHHVCHAVDTGKGIAFVRVGQCKYVAALDPSG